MAKVGKELAVITAGTTDHFNAETVDYTALGMIWNKETYFAFIRPESYTWEFIQNNDYFTVSYFPEKWDKIHEVFGRKSGRDTDKIKETGVTPEFLKHGITYKQADEIFVCKKIYTSQLDKGEIPPEVMSRYCDPKDSIYGEPHFVVIGEIADRIIR